MQQQYQLTFTMPLAPSVKKTPEEDHKLPDDLASLQTVCLSDTVQVESPDMPECFCDQQHSNAKEYVSQASSWQAVDHSRGH